MALKRLKVEQKKLKERLEKGEVAGFDASPKSEKGNDFIWEAYIDGPEDTPYEGGRFKVNVTFPAEYPFKAPSVVFTTKLWHPSISEKGEICLDLLTKWRPVYTIVDVLLQLREMIRDPSPDQSINGAAAEQLKNDKELFNRTVQEWKSQYAM